MIYTVTLNPAIDYVMQVENFRLGEIHRTNNATPYFGGKGINVSLVLNELGVKSVATGFTAGFTGEAIESGLVKENVSSEFIRLDCGLSRINVKIRSCAETDINCQGPVLKKENFDRLFSKLDTLCEGDILVLAGSVPKNTPDDIYEQIMARLVNKKVRFAVDAERQLLLNSLKYKPFLIKPNHEELGEAFGVEITSKESAFKYAAKLQKMGAENVLVSMGKDGAVLLDSDGNRHVAEAYKGEVLNTVGAGDSMLAGFIAGWIKTGDYDYALRLGAASGSATAFSEGLANKFLIEKLFNS